MHSLCKFSALSSRTGTLVFIAIFVMGCSASLPPAKIWYITKSGDVATIEPSTGTKQTVVDNAPESWIRYAKLSPDRQHLLYGKISGDGEALWLSASDGANQIQVTRVFSITSPTWLSDDQFLWYGADGRYTTSTEGEIALYDVQTRQMQHLQKAGKLTSCNDAALSGGSAWMPLADQSGSSLGRIGIEDNTIRVEPVITLNLASVPNLKGGDCQSWTAEGKEIVFTGSEGYTLFDTQIVENLYLATEQGQIITRLTDFGQEYSQAGISNFEISPDGRWILFLAGLAQPKESTLQTGVFLGLYDTAGRELTWLGQWHVQGKIVWSPDNRSAAIVLLPGNKLPYVNEQWDVYVVDVEPKTMRKLTMDSEALEVFGWTAADQK